MKKQLSRRDFLKAASLGGASVTFMAIASCAPQVVEKTVEVIQTVQTTVQVKETVPVQQTVIVQQPTTKPSAPVNISFFHAWTESIAGPVIKPMIEQYMADHPGVIISQTSLTTNFIGPMIMSAVAAGTPPDIGWGYSLPWVKANALVPIDDYLTKFNYEVDQVYPYLWDLLTVDGKKYAMPVENSSVAWYYKDATMKEVGLTAPSPDWDWNDLMEYGKKLTKKTGNNVDRWGVNWPMWMWYAFMPLLMQEGGEFVSDDMTKPAFNSEAGLKAMKFVQSLREAGVVPPTETTLNSETAFPSGLSGLSWDGPWRFGNYINELKLDGVHVVQHPKCPDTGSNISYVFGGGLGVFKTTDVRQEASMEFLTWFLSKDNNASWGIQTGYLPIRKDSPQTPAFKDFLAGKGSILKTFIDVFDIYKPFPGANILPKYYDIVSIFNEECWQQVVLGKRTPEEGLAQAEKKILADPTLFQL
jgi:sn-glycerol 3-phosphate transport system substrate-binding protein